MDKIMKKAIAACIMSAGVCAAISANRLPANAVSNKVSLESSKTLAVGQSYKLKLKNASGWEVQGVSSANQKIVKIAGKSKNAVTLSANRIGWSRVTVKVKNKKDNRVRALKCQVKVVAGQKASVKRKVSTQVQLESALRSKDTTQITIRSTKETKYNIPAGTYQKVDLIVKAEKAAISNGASFKSIQLKSVGKRNSWTEKAKGNSLRVSSTVSKIVVGKSAEVSQIVYEKAGASTLLSVKGGVSQVVANAKTQIGISGTASKEIPVKITEAAEGTSLTASLPVGVDVFADNTNIILKKGAGSSGVSTNAVRATVINESGEDVVVQDANGKSSLASGQTVLTADLAGLVPPRPVMKIEVDAVRLDKNAVTIEKGKSISLTATVTPNDASNKSVTWSSSNPSVASVSGGKVTGYAVGEARITAAASNGKTAVCTVAVREPAAESIVLDQESIQMKVGDRISVHASVLTAGTEKTVTWFSSDSSVAFIENKDGNFCYIVAKKSGSALITAKTSDGKTAVCTVTVSESVREVDSISLNLTNTAIQVGKSILLTASITPADAADQSVEWSSSNPSVASVSGGKVVGNAAGKATITAKARNGKTAVCTVTVEQFLAEATGITLSDNYKAIQVGESFSISATVMPENAADQSVEWSSSSPAVATVVNGKVEGKAVGTSTITAKTANGKTAKCTVSVRERIVEVSRISFDQEFIKLEPGQSVILTATIFPEDATNKKVEWTDYDPAILDVMEEKSNSNVVRAKITAKAAGATAVTATIYDGGGSILNVHCQVAVEAPVIRVEGISLEPNSLLLEKGKTTVVRVSLNPYNATDRTVTWTSSDESVVKVEFIDLLTSDPSVTCGGNVTAVGAGKATITATAGNGKTATCEVTVGIADIIGSDRTDPVAPTPPIADSIGSDRTDPKAPTKPES